MAKLVFDKSEERLWETGVEQCVLYTDKNTSTNNPDKAYNTATVWNGVTKIDEKPTGGDANDLYADDMKYASIRGAEKFEASVEAYMYPDNFAECDGSAEPVAGLRIGQQKRKPFGLCYKTAVGDANSEDVDINEHYKLHLIWNATASPSEKSYQTVNENPDASTFSWELTTNPMTVTDYKPTASMTIDSAKVDVTKLTALLDILYGTTDAEPYLPTPDAVINMFKTNSSAQANP